MFMPLENIPVFYSQFCVISNKDMVDMQTCEAAVSYFRVLKLCMLIEFGKAWNIP